MKILGKYSPVEYAAFWGCDPCYDHFPRLHGDGYLFYSFGSKKPSKEYLKKFLAAIDRTIEFLEMREITPYDDLAKEEQVDDVQGLTELRGYAEGILKKVKNSH